MTGCYAQASKFSSTSGRLKLRELEADRVEASTVPALDVDHASGPLDVNSVHIADIDLGIALGILEALVVGGFKVIPACVLHQRFLS